MTGECGPYPGGGDVPWWMGRRRLLAMPTIDSGAPGRGVREFLAAHGYPDAAFPDITVTAAIEAATEARMRAFQGESNPQLDLMATDGGSPDLLARISAALDASLDVALTYHLFACILGDAATGTINLQGPEVQDAFRIATAADSPASMGVTQEEFDIIRQALTSANATQPWMPVAQIVERWNNTVVLLGLYPGAAASEGDSLNVVRVYDWQANNSTASITVAATGFVTSFENTQRAGFSDTYLMFQSIVRNMIDVFYAPPPGVCASVEIQLSQVCERWTRARNDPRARSELHAHTRGLHGHTVHEKHAHDIVAQFLRLSPRNN
jgi:hypothetical protein